MQRFLVIFAVLLSMVLVETGFSIQTSATSGNQTNCPTSVLGPQIDNLVSSVPTQSAQSLAQQYLSQHGWALQNLTFNSFVNSLSFNLTSCAVTFQSVGVAYDSKSKNNTLVLSENPEATVVRNLTIQEFNEKGTTYWSGYQFNYGKSYDVQARWSIPSASNPDSNHCWNGNQNICDLAIWTGESGSFGGGSDFAQGGTDSIVTCRFITKVGWICTPSYDMWWTDFPPAGSVTCGGTPNQGDNVIGEMSWSSNAEKIYVYDFTTGGVCNASKSGSEPTWQQFMFEFPTWTSCFGFCSGFYYLPSFQTTTVAYAQINGIPINQLSNPMPAYMTNGPGGEYNIILGSIYYSKSIGAYFTEQWQTSS